MKKLIFIVLFVVSSTSYGMCEDYPPSTMDFFNLASGVVLAEVLSAEKVQGYDYKANYKVIETYKSSPQITGEAIYQKEPHSILLTPGELYLFFFQENNFISICNGSRPLNGKLDVVSELRTLNEN